MSDNVVANSGDGLGPTFGADEIGGIKFPRVKIIIGADGTNDGDVAAGNPLPVTGTLTVNSHAVTNAGTFAVQESQVVTEDAAEASGVKMFMAGVVRRDTAASSSGTDGDYSTMNVDANGKLWVNASGETLTVASHAVTNAGTFAVQAAQSGTWNIGTVTAVTAITNALPAGTNAIGKLAANSGVDIGDVDITSVLPGVAATNLGKAEDAAHASGDVGVMSLAVRQDADASFAGTSGDYAPLQLDDNGFLKVNIKAGAGSGGTAATDDGAFTAASGSGTPIMGFVTSDSVDSGDVGVLAMLANRQLKVTLYDSSANELSVGGGTQYTEDAAATANPIGNALIVVREDGRAGSLTSADGDNVALRGNNLGELYVKHTDNITVNAHAVTNAGTFAVQATSVVPGVAATSLGKAEDAAHSSGDVGVMALSVRQDTAAALAGTDADYQPLITDANGKLHVNAGTVTVAAHAVTNAGTFAVQVDGAALTSLQLIDDVVFAEDVAASAADKGLSILAVRRDANTSLVGADNDYAQLQVSALGALKVTVQPDTTGGWDVFCATSGDGSTALTNTAQAVKASAGKLGGWYIYNPNATATYVIIYNTASGSVTVGTTNPRMVVCIPATSGANVEFSNGITFDTAIAVAATTTGPGNTAPSTALEANFLFK